jgi:hypothetical protein
MQMGNSSKVHVQFAFLSVDLRFKSIYTMFEQFIDIIMLLIHVIVELPI